MGLGEFILDMIPLSLGASAISGDFKIEKLQKRIAELEAENADLRSRLDALTAQQSRETSSPEE